MAEDAAWRATQIDLGMLSREVLPVRESVGESGGVEGVRLHRGNVRKGNCINDQSAELCVDVNIHSLCCF